ncbi:hypothetical protein NIES30_21655 [Phormidium tenue NIES-30]|uniref:Uncharacterized protein n=1 Tax=Phormidium tenue NIES-30 TaxID=549789 RepID=A0A1U7J056_9CYAN|nr:hypothetical protein NIES30_21655 [Phormidium tenue NIES-30]
MNLQKQRLLHRPPNPPILGDFEVVWFPPRIGGLGGQIILLISNAVDAGLSLNLPGLKDFKLLTATGIGTKGQSMAALSSAPRTLNGFLRKLNQPWEGS